ncbi:hypothetical protein BSKO_00752 [Bryopsis sp. KO-2023]|nr:hypothetical protein BSKO_00752 [Bryopsis sp. KO-2023]
MANVREVYRKLLRTVDKNITQVTGNTLWRDFVKKEFRKSQEVAAVPHLLNQAEEYVYLVESVHENKELLTSYNITTDKDSQQREQVKKTARVVGLEVPDRDGLADTDFPPKSAQSDEVQKVSEQTG